MFNEDDALIMIIVAVSPNLVDALLEGFQPFFEAHSGVIFVSDIQVGRPVKFMA
ncbi:P-II family nitrogen regulator, partial [Nitrosomonas sp. GH22]|nr:P-II family nitrogen regulator [Nitrosomonas sp. GH22]